MIHAQRLLSCYASSSSSTQQKPHLLLDLRPDHARHLVTIELHDRLLHDDLGLAGDCVRAAHQLSQSYHQIPKQTPRSTHSRGGSWRRRPCGATWRTSRRISGRRTEDEAGVSASARNRGMSAKHPPPHPKLDSLDSRQPLVIGVRRKAATRQQHTKIK